MAVVTTKSSQSIQKMDTPVSVISLSEYQPINRRQSGGQTLLDILCVSGYCDMFMIRRVRRLLRSLEVPPEAEVELLSLPELLATGTGGYRIVRCDPDAARNAWNRVCVCASPDFAKNCGAAYSTICRRSIQWRQLRLC